MKMLKKENIMIFEKYNLKLKENINITNHNLPRFSLSYRVKKNDPRHVSFDIISALSENSDIIIELDTDFFDNNPRINSQYFQQFVDDMSSLGLTRYCKAFPSVQKYTIMGFQIESKKKKQAEKVAVYVPRNIWLNESFRDNLPICGARYYITNHPMDNKDIVNKIWTMDEKEINNTFKLIIFDFAFYGQMGIITDLFNKEDFHRLFGYK